MSGDTLRPDGLSVCFLSYPFMHNQVIKRQEQQEGERGEELGVGDLGGGGAWLEAAEIGSAAQLHIEETFFSEVLIGSSEV